MRRDKPALMSEPHEEPSGGGECPQRMRISSNASSTKGQWFERGTRVDFFDAELPGHRHLEPAALGSYEVLRCARLEDDGARWLDVTLRPFGLV